MNGTPFMSVWRLFFLNFYIHHSSLFLINGYSADNIFLTKEGVAQGYPLAMLAYRIVIIFLIKRLKSTHPDITQPWYTENAGALSMFDNLEQYFNLLKRNDLDRGYYPDPNKSILVVHPKNLQAG